MREAPEILVQVVVEYITGLYASETELSQVLEKVKVILLDIGKLFPIVISNVARD